VHCSDEWEISEVTHLGSHGARGAIHQRKCKNGKKGGFSSRLASNEITTRGYRMLTFAKCTTVMTTILTVTSGL
jgi:hypothetical protein